MKKQIHIICVGFITLNLQLITHNSHSQNVSINNDGTNADANTMLDVKSAGTTSATFGLKIKDSESDNKMVVRSDGNVGIGTTTPVQKLVVSGSDDGSAPNYVRLENVNGSTNNSGAGLEFYSAGEVAQIVGLSANPSPKQGNLDFFTRNASTGMTKVMRMGTNGLVTIGETTNNVGWLDIIHDASASGIRGHLILTDTRAAASSPGATINFRGRYENTNTLWTDYANIFAGKQNGISGNQSGQLIFSVRQEGGGMVERMRMIDTGNIGIGTSTPSYKLEVCGTIGTTAVAVTTGITCSSDIRFKKNIKPLSGALNKIKNINGVTYNWKEEEFPEKNFNDKTQIGVIAQEIEKVFPELVHTDKEGYKSVDYSHLTPILLEAIKEQQQIIENLSTDNKEIIQRLTLLEKHLETSNK